MIRIYGASKLDKVPLWTRLRLEWEAVHFVMRWPWEHVGVIEDTPQEARKFWVEDLEDVMKAQLVMVYGEPQDKLRGALVEAGMAIATGRKVLVVGEHPDYGTWQYHPSVYQACNLDAAYGLLRNVIQYEVT